VWDGRVQDLVAAALAELGSEHALVVHSADGLDELSVEAPTRVVEVRAGRVVGAWSVEPRDHGLGGGDHGALVGGDVAHNRARLEAIVAGAEQSLAAQAVALNAAAALVVGGRAADLAGAWRARRRCSRAAPP